MKTRNIGHKIKRLRELKSLTQEYMAEQLDISRSYYNKIENNQVSLNMDRLQAISEILEIDAVRLMTFDEIQYINQVFHSQVGSGQYINQAGTNDEVTQAMLRQLQLMQEELVALRRKVERA